jgi:hypothetical protein
MQAPVYFTVRLPDGTEHHVATIAFKKDGRVARIDTFGINGDALRNGWYTIEGDELELVTLITYTRTNNAD